MQHIVHSTTLNFLKGTFCNRNLWPFGCNGYNLAVLSSTFQDRLNKAFRKTTILQIGALYC